MGAEVAGKGIGMLNLAVEGVTGGRSVCGVAEGGDGSPRELRVGTEGSAYGSPRKLRMWDSRRQSRGIQGVQGVKGVRLRSRGAAVKGRSGREI